MTGRPPFSLFSSALTLLVTPLRFHGRSAPCLSREQEVRDETKAPIRSLSWAKRRSSGEFEIYRPLAKDCHLADVEQQRRTPLPGFGFPIARYLRAGTHREAASQVVMHERLQIRPVYVLAIICAAHRPDLIKQQAERPVAGLCQYDGRWAEAEFLGSELGFGSSRQ